MHRKQKVSYRKEGNKDFSEAGSRRDTRPALVEAKTEQMCYRKLK